MFHVKHLRAPLFFLAIVGLCFAGMAHAATGNATVTWTNPVTYTDGSALASSAISGSKLVCTFTPTTGAATACALSASSVSGNAQTITTALTYPAIGGSACFSVITTAGGVDSAPSVTPACKTFTPLQPNPPTGVTVTVVLTLNLTSASPITMASVGSPVVTVKP